jgi:hypothetical protein
MSPLLEILIPVTALALLVLVIALCRSAARADAPVPESRRPTTSGERSLVNKRPAAVPTAVDERAAVPPAARAGTRESARPATGAGRAARARTVVDPTETTAPNLVVLGIDRRRVGELSCGERHQS